VLLQAAVAALRETLRESPMSFGRQVEASLLHSFYALALVHQLSTQTMSRSNSTFQVNDRIEARWLEDNKWYPAQVLKVKSQTIFRIRFDGFVEEYDYTTDFLRVLEQASAGGVTRAAGLSDDECIKSRQSPAAGSAEAASQSHTTNLDSPKPATGTRWTGCSTIPRSTTFTHTVTSESLREEGNVVFKNALSLAPVPHPTPNTQTAHQY
jgi:hypothetical protein